MQYIDLFIVTIFEMECLVASAEFSGVCFLDHNVSSLVNVLILVVSFDTSY
jgi:hypothetical protein